MKLYSGTLLTATGVIHTIYALFLGKEAFTEMLNNGLIDSIGENHNLGFAFWFLICGIILILWGETLQYYIRKEQKPAPVFLGYSILLLTIIGCIIEPASGFWLFLPQAIIIIYSNKLQKLKIRYINTYLTENYYFVVKYKYKSLLVFIIASKCVLSIP